MRPASFLALLVLAGCSKAPMPDPEVARLEAELAKTVAERDVEAAEVVRLREELAKATASAYELIVTWPSKGGNDYRRSYPTAEACEAARKIVLADNAARQAAAQARVGTVEGGLRVVAVGDVPGAIPVCLPS